LFLFTYSPVVQTHLAFIIVWNTKWSCKGSIFELHDCTEISFLKTQMQKKKKDNLMYFIYLFFILHIP